MHNYGAAFLDKVAFLLVKFYVIAIARVKNTLSWVYRSKIMQGTDFEDFIRPLLPIY